MANLKTYLCLIRKLCYVNLVAGLVGIISGIIFIRINPNFYNLGSNQDFYKASFILLIQVGVFFVILGFLGICAYRRKQNCTMNIYNIGVIFQLIFIGCTLILMICAKIEISHFKEDRDCSKEDLIQDLKNTYDAGKSLLCSYRCPCDADSFSFPPYIYQRFHVSRYGADRLDECDSYAYKIDIYFKSDYYSYYNYLRNMVRLLKTAEESFDCSGFCSKNSYYVFRNINDRTPYFKKDCKDELLNFISMNYLIGIVITSVLAAYMLIITYLSVSTMFSSEKKENGGFYYEQNKIQLPNNQLNHVQNIYEIQQGTNQNNLRNMNSNHFNANQPTKINKIVYCINQPYPNNYQNQQNVNYFPGIAPPQNIEELPAIQDIQLVNQQQIYPQLQQNDQEYINGVPTPYQENSKYAKH
ncbi:hypothetical protein ABPG74_010058 [Tetrahymena malaccensis]